MTVDQSRDPIEILEKLLDDLNPRVAYEALHSFESIIRTGMAYERSAFENTCPIMTKSNWNSGEILVNRVTELKNKYGPPDFQI